MSFKYNGHFFINFLKILAHVSIAIYSIRKPKENSIQEDNDGLKAEIEDSMGNATGAAVLCLLLGDKPVFVSE